MFRRMRGNPIVSHRHASYLALFSVLGCLIAVSCLAGCATNATLGGSPASAPASDSAVSANASSSAQTSDDTVTVEPQVLFDQDGLTVTLTGIQTNAAHDVALAVHVANNSEIPVSINPAFTAVNGYMVYARDSIEAQSGEEVDGYFTLIGQSLQDYEIEEVGTIQLCVGIASNVAIVSSGVDAGQGNVDASRAVYASNPVTIQTNRADAVANASNARHAQEAGEPLWADGGLRVYQGSFIQDKSIGIAALELWIVNDDDEPVTFDYAIAGVNGLSAEGFNSEQLACGARLRTYLFLDDVLARANLGTPTVTSVDVSFSCTGFDGSEKAASELIHINLS